MKKKFIILDGLMLNINHITVIDVQHKDKVWIWLSSDDINADGSQPYKVNKELGMALWNYLEINHAVKIEPVGIQS